MKDPFPFQPNPFLARAIQPYADYFSLTTLPLHIHEVLAACALYTGINFVLSPLLSAWLFPEHYKKLSPAKRLNWDVHVVSFCQSTLINALALWVMLVDDERAAMDQTERVYGYTGAAGMIQALAAGYFLWDLVITALYLPVFGLGMLAHAICALLVFSLGFRPFVNYYGCVFILWELSSPFLNIHWFCDKLGLTGSKIQLYNGIMLIATFFSCRLVYGTYQSTRVFGDIWAAVNSPTDPHTTAETDVMMFVTESSRVPVWLGVVYLGSNITLNTLNFYWFFKMIEAVRKRFVPQPVSVAGTRSEPGTTSSTTQSLLNDGNARKRVIAEDTSPEDEISAVS